MHMNLFAVRRKQCIKSRGKNTRISRFDLQPVWGRDEIDSLSLSLLSLVWGARPLRPNSELLSLSLRLHRQYSTMELISQDFGRNM